MPWVAPAVDYVAQGYTISLGRLKSALKTFGYLSDDSDDATWDLPEALVAFQLAANLPLTGVYDSATAVVLERPRCGVPDSVDLDSVRANRTRESSIKTYSNYQLYDKKWNYTDLTYRITSLCDGLSEVEVKLSISMALKPFTLVTPLTFTLVDAKVDTADISFSFQSGDHGDGYPFNNDTNDRIPNTLAHAWGPPPNTYSKTFTAVHFDKDAAWTVERLAQIALHEIGHALGLEHSNVRKAAMYATLSNRSTLYADDIAGIQAKYGCHGDRWSSLDENSDTVQIAAKFQSLYQRHKDGSIYRYASQTGKWICIDDTNKAIDIVAGGRSLYKLQSDGGVYQYSQGWVNIDTNTAISAIAVGGSKLYKLHSDGSIYKYDSSSGTWISLPDNDASHSTANSIVADSIGLYKLDNSGNAYTYLSDGNWVPTGSYSDTTQIAAAGGVLYQLRNKGGIFEYPSWDECDRNTDTLSIAAGGEDLFRRHASSIWRYTGTPGSGWQQVDDSSNTASIYVSDVGTCYQLHTNGQIWVMNN